MNEWVDFRVVKVVKNLNLLDTNAIVMDNNFLGEERELRRVSSKKIGYYSP